MVHPGQPQPTPGAGELGELCVHDHLCLIYESRREQLDGIVPFVRAGLAQGDRLLYVADAATVDGIGDELHLSGVDVAGAVGAGRLAMVTGRQSYLGTGRFDPDAMLDYAAGVAEQSVLEGYRALRIAGEMSWALGGDPGTERLIEYEVKVNDRLARTPAMAICQYDRTRFSPDVIRDVIRTHPLVMVGGRVCRNFYYVPPGELLGKDRLSHEVDRLLENIQERERAEDALRDSERRLQLVLEGSRDAFWDWDLDSGAVVFSARWTEILGRQGDPPCGALGDWDRLVHPDDLPETIATRQAHLAGKTGHYEIEHRVRAAGGGWRWVLARGRVVARQADGRAARMSGTITDVTERRGLQARLQLAGRLASVGTLAAGVAHEINNPLTFVTGNLSFLSERLAGAVQAAGPGGPLDELRQATAEALDGAARVGGIVQGLRRFAHPASDARRVAVDVAAEIAASVAIARSQVASRARLVVEVAPGLPHVAARPNELGQVLVNLLVNGAQAIPEGRAALNQVRVSAKAAAGWVVLEVSDSGAGMSADVREQIFDPFFTTKEVGSGTGLGLAICHGIVEGLGGAIEVESEAGVGTCFRVRLPASAERGPAPGPDLPAADEGRRRVLVVDDEPLLGRAVARMLGRAHDVEFIESALEAARRLEAGERWDLVLCDLIMPELTGMALADRLERSAPDALSSFVFMTGGAYTESSRAFLKRGDRRFIEKPIELAALRALVGAMPRRA